LRGNPRKAQELEKERQREPMCMVQEGWNSRSFFNFKIKEVFFRRRRREKTKEGRPKSKVGGAARWYGWDLVKYYGGKKRVGRSKGKKPQVTT